jgi:hypothetical protein
MSTAKTIQIFLPSGDPQGIRFAEITTRIVQVIDVPRSLLGDFLKMPESGQVAVYFLVGEAEDGSSHKVYVGQTGDLKQRLSNHNKEKEFWQRVLVLVSRTNSLTQTHALFLEWYCLHAVRKAGRYSDENSNSGSKPHTPPPLEADCMEVFETGQSLLATLGHPLFEPLARKAVGGEEQDLLFCRASDSDARGIYTEEGFVVLKGSSGRRENVRSIRGTAAERFRNRLIESGVIKIEGDRAVFTKDHLFSSPSMAGMAVTGRSANGWIEWRTKDGATLHSLKREATS